MEVRTIVEFSDKEIKDILVEKAKASFGKELTPGASCSVEMGECESGTGDHKRETWGRVTFNGKTRS